MTSQDAEPGEPIRDKGTPGINPKMRLGILLSGRGSNFLAIADAVLHRRLNAEIAIVISNVPDAQGIQRAAALDFQTAVFPSKGRPRAEHDADLIACLLKHDVDLVCLAGYMRLLSPQFITAFPNRVLNIHPSLLPAFPGLDAQKQAFDYGVKWTGCTVHFVDEHLDHGAIILQRAVSNSRERRPAFARRTDPGGRAYRLHRIHRACGQRRMGNSRTALCEEGSSATLSEDLGSPFHHSLSSNLLPKALQIPQATPFTLVVLLAEDYSPIPYP